MAASGSDPRRVLGVAPDAGEDDIRRAYRRLAKRFHPDAGHGQVARFLEVQAAYERLLGDRTAGPPGRRREARTGRGAEAPGAGAPGAPDPRSPRTPREDRAREDPPRDDRPREDRTREERTRDDRAREGQAPGQRPRTGPQHGSRPSGHRRATLGSTSYDDAEDVFEPTWDGASWYGQGSGTYWTVNPREYADPRKHGPEYQARARRRAGEARAGVAGSPGGTGDLDESAEPGGPADGEDS